MKVIPNNTVTDTGFTRASTATYMNVAGVLSTAAINAIRLNFDGPTHAPLGMLLEMAATNLCTYSEQLDNAAYVPTAATVTANAVAALDGVTTADKLVEGVTNAAHYLGRVSGFTITAYSVNTVSFFVKAAGRTLFKARYSDSTGVNGVEYQFDLSNGTVSAAVPFGTASQYSASITNYGNGWYRCSVTAIVDTFSTATGLWITLSNGSSTVYTGDGTSGLYLWGFQLEFGTAATSYIPTVASTVTRAKDVLTSATFGSSTVAEPSAGETVWSAATAYTAGQECILTSTHRKYKRLISGTTATAPNLDATNWADNGPTNRWSMFDLNRNAQTVATGPLQVVVAPGKRIDSIGLVGLVANSVRIQVMVGNVTYYDNTITTLLRNTLTWSQYLLGSFRYAPSVVQFNIPPISNATVIITLEGGTVKVAGLIMGTGVYLGLVQYQATSDSLNFSKVDRDAFGNATLVARRSVPKVTARTILPNEYVDSARAVRTDLNAVVAMWSGLDDQTTADQFESLLIVGIYKEFSINLDQPEQATVSLQLEEI